MYGFKKTCSAGVLSAATMLAGVGVANVAFAADDENNSEGNARDEIVVAEVSRAIEMIVVTGSSAATRELGGSAHFLSEEVLDTMKYADINRMLRMVPGVNIQEEDGFGLRPNIGLRGTGLDRSAKIAILEDGVLAAPAPYAAPSAYYFPTAGRMQSIEVVKGPAGIKYGPLTTGGAINLFSTEIPEALSYQLEVAGGSDGYGRIHGIAGKTFDGDTGPSIGLLAEVYSVRSDGFKELDGGGDTGFNVEDWVGKFSYETGSNAALQQYFELKVQYTDEISNETYLGLTEDDFAANPYRRYRASQLDLMDSEHKGIQASWRANVSSNIDVSVVAYRNDFQRNWFKLSKVMGTSITSILADPVANAAAYDAMIGANGFVSADDDFEIKNNNRTYYAQGIQTIAAIGFETGAASHTLEVSARYHKDEMDRFQWVDKFRMDNGKLVQTSSGVPGTDSNRLESAEAWSFFAIDEIFWGPVTLTPGVRVEMIELKREDYGKSDPDRTGVSLNVRENDVDIVIPGVGIAYDLNDEVTLIGGVHKGFTHPSAGSSADAEESVNYELGARYYSSAFGLEIIGFFNDYSNLVGTCTASTGGGCDIGDQFDGGEVEVTGVEVMGLYDVGETASLSVSVPLRLAYTYTQAEFQNDFNSGYKPWGGVTSGDEMPLIPEHQFNISIGIEAESWSVNVNVNYTAETRATAGQGTIVAGDNIDARTVVDVEGEYQVTGSIALFATVENVFDEEYLVSRTPAGLRPGKPQSFQVGVKAAF